MPFVGEVAGKCGRPSRKVKNRRLVSEKILLEMNNIAMEHALFFTNIMAMHVSSNWEIIMLPEGLYAKCISLYMLIFKHDFGT